MPDIISFFSKIVLLIHDFFYSLLDEHSRNFYSLLIISGTAFLIPIFVNKIKSIRIPVVIAEIIIGIIIGKSFLNLIVLDDTHWINFLSEFGFAFLMFLSGVEIDFSYFKTARKKTTLAKKGKISGAVDNSGNPLLLGAIIFLSSLLLSYIFSSVLLYFEIISNPILTMLIFSTTSLGIVVPTLKERRILSTSIGQTILISALIADFATMLMLPIVLYIIVPEQSHSLVLSFVLFLSFGIIYFLGKLFKINFNANTTYETSQLAVRAAFALVLVFVTISQIVNVEFILGAFLAGVLFSLLFNHFRDEIIPKLDAVGYGFLIPIFFIMIGVNMDLKSVLNMETLLVLPLFIIIVFAVKIIPSLLLKRYFTMRETIGSGFLLSSRLSLIIAISLVALEAGLITESIHSTFILVAVITCLFSPILFFKIFPESEETKNQIILAGNSEYVVTLATKIISDDITLFLADCNEKIIENIKELNIPHKYLPSLNQEVFSQLEISSITTFVSAYDKCQKNYDISTMAKSFGISNVACLIQDPILSHELEKNDIKAVTPMKSIFYVLYNIVKYPELFDIIYDTEEKDNIDVKEFRLNSHSIVGSKLKNIKLPGDCLILMIARSGKRIVPHGSTTLQRGDIIIIIGNKEYMNNIEDVVY